MCETSCKDMDLFPHWFYSSLYNVEREREKECVYVCGWGGGGGGPLHEIQDQIVYDDRVCILHEVGLIMHCHNLIF